MDKIIKQTFKNIKSLEIQGATAVAKAIICALNQYGNNIKSDDFFLWEKKVEKAGGYLLAARPTEPLAQNGVNFIFSALRKQKSSNVRQAKKRLKTASFEFLAILEKAAGLIVKNGQKIIRNDDDILTHCHSWLVEQILIEAKENKKRFKVYNTETRPLFQGRITSRKLLNAGIPTAMVSDSSAGFLISNYSGRDLMLDKIILGADAILNNGSVINKIGSFSIALVAHYEKKPIYIATTLLKYHPHSWIRIEKRPPKEIWLNAPNGLKIINFAFDIVPAKFIKGIICEAGIIKPQEIKKHLKKIYPFL